ncbi:MAG: lytic transglycosylase domain-containing protein [Candidatus Brocadiales bacterium]|nr:lytic transglycosylase domain-containing protein [Candidatus Bathyanammoxibius sp.]
MNNKYDDIIADVAVAHEFPPEFIKAIVLVESAFNPNAVRFEPGFYKRYMPPKGTPDLSVVLQIQRSFSYGLMQIMGQVAVERGFRHTEHEHSFGSLFNPRINLEYGCKQLVWLCEKLQRYEYLPNIELLAIAYNGGLGSAKKLKETGATHNESYGTRVVTANGLICSQHHPLRMSYNLVELLKKHGKQKKSEVYPIWRCDTGHARTDAEQTRRSGDRSVSSRPSPRPVH